jgi:SSS family solute:Na+ symporter
MNTALFYTIFILLTILYLILGLIVSRGIKTQADYFLAGRNLGFFAVTASLLATHIGGGLILGTADDAFLHGIHGIYYALGVALGFIVMSLGLAARLRDLNVDTTAELFQVKYGSGLLRKLAAIIIMLSMAGILVAQIIAARRFMIGLEIYNHWLFVGFWLFVIGYTMIGGLKAVVVTDIVQVSIIIIVFFVIFLYLQPLFPAHEVHWLPESSSAEPLNVNWIGLLFMPLLFNIVEQDMAQRYFAAKNRVVATLAAATTAIIILLFALIPVYLGVVTQDISAEIIDGGSILIIGMRALLSDGVIILIACALLAAIVSTADSLLCAISSNLSQDFAFFRRDNHYAVQLSRALTLVCGLLTLSIAFFFDNILQVLVYSYSLPVACLVAPIFFCLVLPRVYLMAAWCAVLAGFSGFIFASWQATWFGMFKEVFPLGLSILGYLMGHVVAKRLGMVPMAPSHNKLI